MTRASNLPAEISRQVYELFCAPPHLPPRARFTVETWPVYCGGYTWGLVMALRVVESAAAAVTRRELAAADPARAIVLRYFWRVMRWERVRAVNARARGAA